jgi:hypothetical protein
MAVAGTQDLGPTDQEGLFPENASANPRPGPAQEGQLRSKRSAWLCGRLESRTAGTERSDLNHPTEAAESGLWDAA